MAVNKLPKYKDLRGKLPTKGSYKKYAQSKKTWLVVHHSLTETGSALAYANYHVYTLGWPAIAYHFIIDKDGTINQTNDLDACSYHVGNSNSKAIGICLTGDFRKGHQKPTQEQRNSLYLLTKELRKDVPSIERVLGHQECPGYSWKNCPGDNWSYQEVIKGIGVDLNEVEQKAETPKPTNDEFHIVEKGDTLWGISVKHNVTLAEIKVLNPLLVEKSLQIGDKVLLKGKATEPKQNPTPSVKYPLPSGIVKKGDEGTDVKQIQQVLNLVNYKVGNVDGVFGEKTEQALKNFQKANGLSADGVYGPKTKDALDKKANEL